MYAKGMTTRQISETIEDIYGFETSEGFISDVTDKIQPQIEDWQNRPLDEVYPFLYIDAIHYSVRDNGVIRKLAIYEVAGKEQLLAERAGIGKIARGDIAVTGAYNLKAGDTISVDHDVRLKIELLINGYEYYENERKSKDDVEIWRYAWMPIYGSA